MKTLYFAIGVLFYPFFRFSKVKETWIFGAEHGNAFIDNSKYFFEYLLTEHREIRVFWITKSDIVYKDLKSRNLPVVKNLSLKGLYLSATSKFVVFSTSRNDILFIHPKKNRKIINLWHGMPIKKIVFDHSPHKIENVTFKGKLWDKFVAAYKHTEVDFNFATSAFFAKILESCFRNKNVYVTGQARTDVFFNWNASEIRKKMGFSLTDKIVTYMPTHRAYGKGALNPRIFINNDEAIKYFEKNNYKIVWKFHKNMLQTYKTENVNSNVLIDLSLKEVDPQELLYISDILITDYSSCYIDYLLLKRPVIFYFYDNYSVDDNELYFEPDSHNIGSVVRNEKDLFAALLDDKYYETKVEYHKYFDGESCKRIFLEITK
ncbi:CDP-glycerol:poly(glycerophosphate) glycerophosphotransferase [compost metagenome]